MLPGWGPRLLSNVSSLSIFFLFVLLLLLFLFANFLFFFYWFTCMWPTNPNNKHTLKTTTKSTVTLNINSRWERESHEWESSVGACQIFRFGVGQSRRQRRSGEVALQRSRDKNTHASPPRIHTNKCFCERGFLQPLLYFLYINPLALFSQQCFVTLFSLFTTYGLFLYIYVCTYIYFNLFIYVEEVRDGDEDLDWRHESISFIG